MSSCERSRRSTPFRRMAPFVASWKRSKSLATVDLPEPVEPTIAVVCPRRQAKLRLHRVSSSASSKRNDMWSNTATASAPSADSGAPSPSVALPSTMLGSISSTCCARLRHAAARGSVSTTICAIITKNRIRSAYSSTAEMLPICMAWTPTRLPPTHSTATSAMFIKKKLELSRPTNRWLTLMALAA